MEFNPATLMAIFQLILYGQEQGARSHSRIINGELATFCSTQRCKPGQHHRNFVWGVEFACLFTRITCKFSDQIFIHVPDDVVPAGIIVVELIDQFNNAIQGFRSGSGWRP